MPLLRKDIVMLAFEKKTEAFIQKHSLMKNGDFVLTAVSGGPDSIALLDFLKNREKHYDIKVAATHVNHMLRGEESLSDLEYVKEYCERRGILFTSASIHIKDKMAIDKTGMQETARKYRYQFFEETMNKLHANKLAVGQHGDDQVETILMRMTRGSSGKPRAGIQLKRPFGNGELIRPLLNVSKKEIEEYCAEFKLEPRQDKSNFKHDYTRNRFRLEVLPFLQAENEHVHEHFQRFSEDLTEDEEFLLRLTENEMNKICQFGEQEIELNISAFNTVPLPLQRRGIHLILNYLYKQHVPDLSALHVDLIKELFKSANPSGKLDLPSGLKVLRSYGVCKFTFVEPGMDSGYHFELNDGDQALLPHGKMIRVDQLEGLAVTDWKDVLVLNPSEVQLPIIVRTRRLGDRIRLKGMDGTKKVKDIFIDLKIPLHERSVWPVVTDQSGKLLWLPGLKKSIYDTLPSIEQSYYVLRFSNQTSPGGHSNQ